MVMLMYLEDDEACVGRLLEETGVPVYSRLQMEGVATVDGSKGTGWFGDASAPFASSMILAVVGDEVAADLLRAVAGCRGVQDPAHPIRAVQLDVERQATCQCD